MKKADRQKIFDKYGGKCAYCGEQLQDVWHVDELLPIVRNYIFDKQKGRYIHDGTCQYPERITIENQMPACPSCNINKHSDSLEEFRRRISGLVVSLNRDSVQYKVAKRYGLIQETQKPIIFYFEQENKK